MTARRVRTYLDTTIYHCASEESRLAGYRWWIPSVHPITEIPYGEQNSARYYTLADAHAAILRDPPMGSALLPTVREQPHAGRV